MIYFAFGQIFEEPIRPIQTDDILTIYHGGRYIVVLKESMRAVDLVAQPIGVSTMHSYHHSYLESFMNALGNSGLRLHPDWIFFEGGL